MTLAGISRVDQLITELPKEIVITDPGLMASYAHDQSRFTPHTLPEAVLAPRTTTEVSACLAAAHRHRVAVVPRGAGSGLSGAANATAGSIVLTLHRMDQIIELDRTDQLAVVQPGVVTAALRARAVQEDLFYPPDPGSVEFSTIGGNAATNAGGMCCAKYGVTADFVLGLEVVLADGRVMRTGRRTVKGVAGYDLTRLFVGSEGTLGVLTEITVRLLPKPRGAHTLVASFERLSDVGQVVLEVSRAGLAPSLMEILDRTTVHAVDAMANMGIGGVHALLLIQCDDADAHARDRIAAICRQSGALDIATSSDPAEGSMLLEARRLALPALERLGDWMLDDVAVPLSRVVDLIAAIEEISDRLALTIGVFGHAGDGNLHPTIIFDDTSLSSRKAAVTAFAEITQKALEFGGTITGEHGVGQLKKAWLTSELSAVALAVHASIKAAIDPDGILNPGKVLPDVLLKGEPNMTSRHPTSKQLSDVFNNASTACKNN